MTTVPAIPSAPWSLLRIWVLCVWVLCAGCDRGDESPSSRAGPQLVEYDPLPADMGLWTCDSFRRQLAGSPREVTLNRLLEIRPHRFWEPADQAGLVELDASVIAGSRRDRLIYRQLLEPDAAGSLTELVRAADEAGLHLRVQSAYRTPSYQNYLWKLSVRAHKSDLAAAGFAVAPPCFSEHATGRAVDFTVDPHVSDFSSSAEYRWLQEHAQRWGWVQSFRRDNGAVHSPNRPGVFIEPWHFHHVSMEGT